MKQTQGGEEKSDGYNTTDSADGNKRGTKTECGRTISSRMRTLN